MNISLETIKLHIAFRQCINSIPLSDIHLFDDDGNEIPFDKEIIEEFELTGLSNIDFITSDYYLKGQ